MIFLGKNKSVICKGDFCPAQLWRGNRKIAGYTKEAFEGKNTVTLKNCYNDRVHEGQILGNSVQDGTPTPENPIEVKSVGEYVPEGDYAGKFRIPVNILGKNLWTGANTLVSNSSEPILRRYIFASGNKWMKSGTTITISFTEFVSKNDTRTGPRFNISTGCADGTSLNSVTVNYVNKNKEDKVVLTYTIPQTSKEISHLVILFMNYSDNPGGVFNAYVRNIQIEIGDTATEFEPYVKPQTTNIYLDDPLRKVGAYKDYIDFDKGVVVRNIGKQIFKGSENWEYDGSTNQNSFQLQIYNANLKTSLVSNYSVGAMSDRLIGRMWETLWQNYYKPAGATDLTTGVAVSYNIGDKRIYLKVSPFSALPTLSEWKAYLAQWNDAGTPFEMYYVMPSEENPIDLPMLPTFRGTTIIEIGTEIETTIRGKHKKTE